MSLLGIDVGTTGCKASAYAASGQVLAFSYREYDVDRPQSGYAELDARAVWRHVQDVIAETASCCAADPVEALSVCSLGEAVAPVGADREILGPSILNFDERGAEYLGQLPGAFGDEAFDRTNGNTLGNHYGLTKLLWIRDHEPKLYERTHRFLPWGAFVSFMLGAEPAVDYSLANRLLLFDLDACDWSADLCRAADLDLAKLPAAVPSGTAIGTVSPRIARGPRPAAGRSHCGGSPRPVRQRRRLRRTRPRRRHDGDGHLSLRRSRVY